ncbi:hypothetical protein IT397_02480 [Candidatus Nomurabacteria bacterium]|nr:hypothetical protein [Candidatus Nomurabacteria bacterium]
MAFVSPAKHFPLDIVPYLPASKFPDGETNPLFKDKIRIAKELFDKSLETLNFSAATFDSWYAATHLLEHIHLRKKFFFSEIKSNRNIFMHHPVKRTQCCVKSDVLSCSRRIVTLIKKHYWDKIKFVNFKTTDGSEVSHKTNPFEAKLKDCDIPLKFVVVLGKWNEDDDNACHILNVIVNRFSRWIVNE